MEFDIFGDLAALASLMGGEEEEEDDEAALEDVTLRPIKLTKTNPPASMDDASTPQANAHASPWIREMILRDLDRHGHRLLPIYLTTDDLLRLSECCKATMPNRYLLQSIKLIKHPHANTTEATCTNLLLHQSHLTHVSVEDASAVSGVLEALKKGMGHHLISLDLSKFVVPNFKLSQLAILLAKHTCQNLEELGIRMGADDMGLLTVLAQGTCPQLRRLVMHVTNAKKVLMSEYFHSKFCSSLAEVELKGAAMSESEAMALLGGDLHHLPKVNIHMEL